MNSSQIRIIGGAFRGRALIFPSLDQLRPTPNRLRETLFNWLMFHVQDAVCLDAYSGSGALGFEALSRGARTVYFLEQNPAAIAALKKSAERFRLPPSQASIIQTDTLSWLKRPATVQFDLIFLDPPFQSNLIFETLNLIKPWIKPTTLVYIESARDKAFELPLSNWHIHKQTQAGEVFSALLIPNHS